MKNIEVGDKVTLPFDEEGEVKEIINIPWGYNYLVEITKSKGVFNKVGEVNTYKIGQIHLKNDNT